MAPKSATLKPSKAAGAPTAAEPLLLSPELEAFVVVKLGRPGSIWRWLNRVTAWWTGTVSRDEWDLAFAEALKHVDGKQIFPEDAARRVERLTEAMLNVDKGRVKASCAKCELSETAIMIAFMDRPSAGFYHARAIRLKDPGKRRG